MDHNVEINATAGSAPIRLADDISNVLQKCGHARPRAWEAGFLATHPDAASDDTERQRMWINRYWRLELSKLQDRTGMSTMDARFCLVDNGSLVEWLKLFERGVASWIVQNDLPHTPS